MICHRISYVCLAFLCLLATVNASTDLAFEKSTDSAPCVGGYLLNVAPTVRIGTLTSAQLANDALVSVEYSQLGSIACVGKLSSAVHLASSSSWGQVAANQPALSNPLRLNPARNYFLLQPVKSHYTPGDNQFQITGTIEGHGLARSRAHSRSKVIPADTSISAGYTRVVLYNLMQDIGLTGLSLVYAAQPVLTEKKNGLLAVERSFEAQSIQTSGFTIDFPLAYGESAQLDVPIQPESGPCDQLIGVFGTIDGVTNALPQVWPSTFNCSGIPSGSVSLLVAYGNMYANIWIDQFQLDPQIDASKVFPKPSSKNRVLAND